MYPDPNSHEFLHIKRVYYLPRTEGAVPYFIKNKDSHINLISYIYYLFNLLKIVINIIKLVLRTYAVHVEDPARENTIETALQVQIPSIEMEK